MWSRLLLCAFVGFVVASYNPGWKDGTEYVYEVRGRSLVSLDEVANKYTGMLLKAKLTVHPRVEGHLLAKITNAQYAHLNSELPEGWNTEVPDSQVSYEKLPTTDKPFEIVMEQGVVKDLVVDREMPEWEANLIKSIVSQIQLDTSGQNRIKSYLNAISKDGNSNSAVFKTLEDTVTGKTETLYDIHPLPEYVLQTKPWLAPFPHLKGDYQILEIVKNKDFTRSEILPYYNFGLAEVRSWEPVASKMGDIVQRTSTGHAVITGRLNRYTIQHSMTVNKIIVNPTFNSKQLGSAVSMLNITLSSAKSQDSELGHMSQKVSLGNLVYRYSEQNTPNNKVHEHSENYSQSSEESNERRSSAESQWEKNQPQLKDAPKSPLLPLTMGYMGASVKKDSRVNIIQTVQKLAETIGRELQNAEQMPKSNTLEKYIWLTSLIRIMNEKELQEVANHVYSQDKEGQAHNIWVAFRDAVAEAGTGPAFLVIRKWISQKQIKHEEAARVVETMSQAVRQPTEEYMRNFYKLVTDHEVWSQENLNETALLAYTSLVHKVYVNKRASHNEYPVHSFGKFRTPAGKKFVQDELIPFLTKQLEQAVSEHNSHKIHVYIRALGNTGHKQILAAFEPYLEGKKQVSQFQRLLMVIAMDKLVKSEPVMAQGVLHKIYQNVAEVQEVRIAAVYQLMRTNPPTDMLQQMASFTNQDSREHVNAAVKSSIESAAQLEGYDFAFLRSSAEAAKPLLTKKQYGLQYSQSYIRNYVVNEMNNYYKQTAQTIVSENSGIPNAWRYSLRGKMGGYNNQLINVQGVVSSVDDLINALEKETKEYQHQQEKREQARNEESSQWSSQNIAKLLNWEFDENEQLEGNLLVQIGDFHKILSFDNQTIKQLPQLVQELEQTLRNGKTFNQKKIFNRGELAIAFPSDMGIPFIFTYDLPTYLHIEGKLQAQAEPQVYSENKLQSPKTLKVQSEIRAIVSSKYHSKFGFINPFSSEEYTAGYDKNIHMHVPLRSTATVNLQQQQVEVELEALQPEQNSKLFHYSSWPFLSKHNILDLTPALRSESTRVIYRQTQHSGDYIVGQKWTGMAFRVKYASEQRHLDLLHYVQQLQQQQSLSFTNPWLDENIQHAEIDIDYEGKLSPNKKLTIRSSYKQHQSNEQQDNSQFSKILAESLSELGAQPSTRKEEFLNKIVKGIPQGKAQVLDTVIEFQGQNRVELVATLAAAKSDVSPNSKMAIYLKKASNPEQSTSFEAALVLKNHISNTNAFDVPEAFEQEPSVTSDIQVAFGKTLSSATKLNANIKFRRSNERKEYLMQQPSYKQCQNEMQQGNKQMPACLRVLELSGNLDRAYVKGSYNNFGENAVNYTHNLFNAVRYLTYFNIDVNRINPQTEGRQNEFTVEARFDPDFKGVNASLTTSELRATIDNLRIHKWLRRAVTVHPVFHLRSRLSGQALGLPTSRPYCVIDQTAANTFDNKTYPVTLENDWTVMLQYVPHQARDQEYQSQSPEQKIKQLLENYIVLIRRQNQASKQKEVKLIIETPETESKTLDVTLKPAQNNQPSKAVVTVNGEIANLEKHMAKELAQKRVQIYNLPNGEVKVEVGKAFYFIYDGSRVKLSALNTKLRNSIRGLCGTFTGEQVTDFLTPNNRIVQSPREFIASYELGQKSQYQHTQGAKKHLPQYVNVISTSDLKSMKPTNCVAYHPRYAMEGNQICFTMEPVKQCKKQCQQQGVELAQNVPVYCLPQSSITTMWKQRIDSGFSIDYHLSQRTATKTISLQVPQRCTY